MTGSEPDTKRNEEGDESGADSSLAKFLTPVPRPRSSLPAPPAVAPPEGASATPGEMPERADVLAAPAEPHHDPNLLSAGDADAPAAPPPRREDRPPADVVLERESRTSDLILETSVRDETVEPDLDLGFLPGGHSSVRARIRRAAIGVAAVALSAGVVLMLTRAPSRPKRAPLATAFAIESVPEPKGAPTGEAVEPTEDSQLEPSAADVEKARDLRREARQLLEAGRIEEGVGLARSAIKADPYNPEAYVLLAAGLQDLGRWQESRDIFTKCVRDSNQKANYECVYFATRSY